MKRILVMFLSLSLLMMPSVPVYAASAFPPPFGVRAEVGDSISISVKWFATNGDPHPADEIFGTIINWGDLILDPGNHVYYGNKARLALITMNNHQRSYTCTMTATSLTKGSDKIPDSSYRVVPVYVSADNGGVTEGTAGPATNVAGAHTIYTSGGTHGMRVVRAYFSVTNVPQDEPAGTYQGTLVFTISG